MAGTVTITELTWKSVDKITFDWFSSGTGSVGAGEATATTTKNYDGEVLRVVCLGTTTTGYAIAINDSDGVDLLGGQGQIVSSGGVQDFGTSTGGSLSYPLSAVSGKISLNITSSCGEAGSTGVAIVYIR